MRLRRAHVVVTAVAVLAGAGTVSGRVLTSEPDPLDLGPVVIVDHSAGHEETSRDLLPSATAGLRPAAGRGPNGSAGGGRPSPVASGPAPGAGAAGSSGPSGSSYGPAAEQPSASRQPGGRPVPPLSPPRSDDDRPVGRAPGARGGGEAPNRPVGG
ncbi:hypothetical protein ACFW15_35045, partial [Streptomyces sp. NPDC058953]